MEAKHPDILPTLKDMENLPVHDLRAAYEVVMLTPPPKRASPDFLRGNIAWTLQAREASESPATLRQTLLIKANGVGYHQNSPCKVGTRLVREWQGQTHEVTVLDKGYHWQGEHYRSLSRIAKEITGTRWSGPRFFGLKDTS